MRCFQRGFGPGVVGSAISLLGACQLVSGLDGLDATRDNDLTSSSETGDVTTSSAVGSGAGNGQGGGAGGAGGAGDSAGAGGILAPGCQLLPKDCPIVLIPDTKVRVDIVAVGSTHIYWGGRGTTDQPAGSIWRATLNGDDIEIVASNVVPAGLAVDDADSLLFWTDKADPSGVGLLYSLETNVMPFVPFASESDKYQYGALALGTTGSYLFYSFPALNRLRQRASTTVGGMVSEPVFNLDSNPVEFAIYQDAVHWHTKDATRFYDWAMNTITTLPAYVDSFGIAVNSTYIYGTLRADPGTVWYVNKATGAGAALAGALYPTYMSADDTFVYWAVDSDADCMNGGGHVQRRSAEPALQEGAILATQLLCPSNLVHSGNYIYWGDATKKIFRAPDGSLP